MTLQRNVIRIIILENGFRTLVHRTVITCTMYVRTILCRLQSTVYGNTWERRAENSPNPSEFISAEFKTAIPGILNSFEISSLSGTYSNQHYSSYELWMHRFIRPLSSCLVEVSMMIEIVCAEWQSDYRAALYKLSWISHTNCWDKLQYEVYGKDLNLWIAW